MNRLLMIAMITLFGLSIANATQKSMICSLQGMNNTISFSVPEKIGNLPSIDFDYPVKTIIFSLRSTNLLLVAMDEEDASRPRVFISAQYSQSTDNYEGQFMTDEGGNEIQLDNGVVTCKLKS